MVFQTTREEARMTIRLGRTLTRRRLLATGAPATALASLGTLASPLVSRAADRALVTHGVQSGDVDVDDRALWSVRLEPHA
jgi:alkaline phosphatase D